MWPILLKVLSIIGIVLACIVGVVILLLLLILLCPITYRVEGSAHENKYSAKVKIKYLFGLVRAGLDYPEPGNIYAKVAWITLYDSSKGDDEVDENEDESSGGLLKKISKMKNKLTGADDDLASANTNSKEENNKASDKTASDNKKSDRQTPKDKRNKEKNDKDKTTESNDDSNEKKKILNPIYYIKKGWENFKYKVIVKIQYIIKDIKYFYALWEHDDTQILVRKVKKHGLKMLKIIAPKKGNVNLVFGTGSPDSTGKIYGVYCALLSKWPKTFRVVPDFENKIIDGSLYIKGYFNLFSLVIQALPIVFSKKLRLTKARFDAHADKKEISKLKTQRKHEKTLQELEEEYSA